MKHLVSLTLFLIGNVFDLAQSLIVDQDVKCSGCICVPKNYSAAIPYNTGNDKTVVYVDMSLNQVTNVMTSSRTVEVKILHSFYWIDNRLQATCADRILSSSLLNHIWIPDFDSENVISFRMEDQFVDKGYLEIVKTSLPDGDLVVKYNFVAIIELYCQMKLEKYPLQEIFCEYAVFNPYVDMRGVEFLMAPEADILKNFIAPKEFHTDVNIVNNTEFVSMKHGNLILQKNGITIYLESKFEKFILTFFFPPLLMNVVNVVSFLIPMSTIPGRFAFILAPLLGIINFLISTLRNSPIGLPPSNSINIWVVLCLIFTVLALVAQLVTIWFHNHRRKYRKVNRMMLVMMVFVLIVFQVGFWTWISVSD